MDGGEEDVGEEMLDLLLAMAAEEDNDNNDCGVENNESTKAQPGIKPESVADSSTSNNSREISVSKRSPAVDKGTDSEKKRVLDKSVRKLEEVDLFTPKEKPKRAEDLSVEELFGHESDEGGFGESVPLLESGREIQRKLDAAPANVSSTSFYDSKSRSKNKWNNCTSSRVAHALKTDKYVSDPFFNIRIINPKVSMAFIKSAAAGKERYDLIYCATQQTKIEKHSINWITMAVICGKSETKRSKQSDKEYIIMRICDMNHVGKEASLFLFGKSYHDHWKLPVSTVIGLQNPSFLKNDKNSSTIATLSINDPTQLLAVGTSKDFGTCTGVTKKGDKCTNVINTSQCDRCSYHAMAAHKKALHQRSELNSSSSGSRAPATEKRKLILGSNSKKNDFVIYGGKTFTGAPVKASLKGVLNKTAEKGNLEATMKMYNIRPEDQARIDAVKKEAKSNQEKNLEALISRPTNASQHMIRHLIKKEMKDQQSTAGVKVKSLTAAQLLQESKRQHKLNIAQRNSKIQLQKREKDENLVNLDAPMKPSGISMTATDYAKLRASSYVKSKGKFKKEDVNAVRKKLTDSQREQVKRKIDDLNESSENEPNPGEADPKKKKLPGNVDTKSKSYQEIRNAKSMHAHITERIMDERQDQYFHVAEKSEGYSEKLLTTHAIEAPIFTCKRCNYTDWKLADRCKKEKHEISKSQAQKRFFKCNDCGERTVTHHRMPSTSCRKCGAMSFSKAGMIREKKVTLPNEVLSLRGNEESNLGNFSNKVDLNIG